MFVAFYHWTSTIAVRRVGGRAVTVGVVIFNLHPWWVYNSWRSGSPYNLINEPYDKPRRPSITASSEKLSAAARCVPPEKPAFPPWQLQPHSTANYGRCSLNTVLENKKGARAGCLMTGVASRVTIAAWLTRTGDYRVWIETRRCAAALMSLQDVIFLSFFLVRDQRIQHVQQCFKVTSQSLMLYMTRARPPQGQWLLCHELSGQCSLL